MKNKCYLSERTILNIKQLEDEEFSFKKFLMYFYDGEDMEICPIYDSLNYYKFSCPTVYPTNLAFKYYTKKLLTDSNWDCLLVISETGEWLFKKEIEKLIKKKKIIVILADSLKEKDFEKTFSSSLNISSDPSIKNNNIIILPWWQHHEHMTLFIENHDSHRTVKCIYFPRRIRKTSVTPILLESDDAEMLSEIFYAYYRKKNTRFLSKEDILEIENEIFQKLQKNN